MLSLLLALPDLVELYIKLRNRGENKLSNPPEIIDLPDRPCYLIMVVTLVFSIAHS